MSLLLVEELAKQLNIPVEDVNTALNELVSNVKSEVSGNQASQIPGLGTFEVVDGAIAFKPDETLALAVNNRYAALDSEMIQLGFEEPEFSISETLDEGNEQEIEQSIIDQIIADDMGSKDLFTDKQESSTLEKPIGEVDPFEGDLKETESELTNSPTPDALASEPEVEPASMKEDDPNANNNSKQDPLGSDTEWSPFFEELEGEEFDIDNTIDLSAEDWQAEIPTPPSSPFASSSDSSNTNADDLYFDVDADPDDTLFAPASIDVEDPTPDDMAWATAPIDDVTDFFEDDPSMSSSFGEEIDTNSVMSAEDEFFSPVSGSASVTPDDTMFSPESIYTEDASTEADDTIFLAPDQTVQAPAPDLNSTYAPQAEETVAASAAAAAAPPRSRNPYAYREERRKAQSKSSMPWIAAAIAAIVIVGGGFAYWQGLLPFGGGSDTTTPPENITAVTPVDPPESNAGQPIESIDPAPAAAGNTPESGAATTPDPITPVTPAPAPVTRIGIDRARGGWTIVVTSKEARTDAERIADDFAQKFGSSQFPVDILTTNQFASTRYRVGVGQFSTRGEATNFLNRSGTDLPGDAWLLRIE